MYQTSTALQPLLKIGNASINKLDNFTMHDFGTLGQSHQSSNDTQTHPQEYVTY